MVLLQLENFTGYVIPQTDEQDVFISGSGKWLNIYQGDVIICVSREYLKDFIKALKEIEKTT
jgi:hypothetical protein